ncbi:hypothetical protein [Candidatus Palauibacter sp.]|uniref:hypothetical protein n=1 Tax=Candidatus Palauibacter sp. TaxID=3101350 RepID=UPI003CC62DC0
MKRIATKSSGAPDFNDVRGYQARSEVAVVEDWINEMRRQGCWIQDYRIESVQDDPPDCVVRFDETRVGVEVTTLWEPCEPAWSFDEFQDRLRKRVAKKDGEASRDSSTPRQFLLIRITYLHNLHRERLDTITLPKPENLDRVYLVVDYQPDPPGEEHYPIFRLRFV